MPIDEVFVGITNTTIASGVGFGSSVFQYFFTIHCFIARKYADSSRTDRQASIRMESIQNSLHSSASNQVGEHSGSKTADSPAAESGGWDQLQVALKLPAVRDQHGPPASAEAATQSRLATLPSRIADLLWGNATRQDDGSTPGHAFLGPNGVCRQTAVLRFFLRTFFPGCQFLVVALCQLGTVAESVPAVHVTNEGTRVEQGW
jgi:hypothetical protein